MKIPSLSSFATSKTGQKFYNWICAKDKEKFLNNTLPSIETVVVTSAYVYYTEKQKDIPKDQKALLQWQNILGGVGGFALGSYLNRKSSKYVDKLAPLIKDNLIDPHKVKTGLAVAFPVIMTGLTMRLLIPIITTEFSVIAENKRRAERDKQNQLNIRA